MKSKRELHLGFHLHSKNNRLNRPTAPVSRDFSGACMAASNQNFPHFLPSCNIAGAKKKKLPNVVVVSLLCEMTQQPFENTPFLVNTVRFGSVPQHESKRAAICIPIFCAH